MSWKQRRGSCRAETRQLCVRSRGSWKTRTRSGRGSCRLEAETVGSKYEATVKQRRCNCALLEVEMSLRQMVHHGGSTESNVTKTNVKARHVSPTMSNLERQTSTKANKTKSKTESKTESKIKSKTNTTTESNTNTTTKTKIETETDTNTDTKTNTNSEINHTVQTDAEVEKKNTTNKPHSIGARPQHTTKPHDNPSHRPNNHCHRTTTSTRARQGVARPSPSPGPRPGPRPTPRNHTSTRKRQGCGAPGCRGQAARPSRDNWGHHHLW